MKILQILFAVVFAQVFPVHLLAETVFKVTISAEQWRGNLVIKDGFGPIGHLNDWFVLPEEGLTLVLAYGDDWSDPELRLRARVNTGVNGPEVEVSTSPGRCALIELLIPRHKPIRQKPTAAFEQIAPSSYQLTIDLPDSTYRRNNRCGHIHYSARSYHKITSVMASVRSNPEQAEIWFSGRHVSRSLEKSTTLTPAEISVPLTCKGRSCDHVLDRVMVIKRNGYANAFFKIGPRSIELDIDLVEVKQ